MSETLNSCLSKKQPDETELNIRPHWTLTLRTESGETGDKKTQSETSIMSKRSWMDKQSEVEQSKQDI